MRKKEGNAWHLSIWKMQIQNLENISINLILQKNQIQLIHNEVKRAVDTDKVNKFWSLTSEASPNGHVVFYQDLTENTSCLPSNSNLITTKYTVIIKCIYITLKLFSVSQSI